MSPQEKLLVVGTVCSIHSVANTWKQHQHASHCLPEWPVGESKWLCSGHTSPGREIPVEQPSSDWFASPWLWGALAQLPPLPWHGGLKQGH